MKRERESNSDTVDPGEVLRPQWQAVDENLAHAQNHALIGNFEEAFRIYRRLADDYFHYAAEQQEAADNRLTELGVALQDNFVDNQVRRDMQTVHRATSMVRFLQISAEGAVRANQINYEDFANVIERLPLLAQVRAARQGVDTFAEFEMVRDANGGIFDVQEGETTGDMG